MLPPRELTTSWLSRRQCEEVETMGLHDPTGYVVYTSPLDDPRTNGPCEHDRSETWYSRTVRCHSPVSGLVTEQTEWFCRECEPRRARSRARSARRHM